MKKLLELILIASMIFTMTACGNKEEAPSTVSQTQTEKAEKVKSPRRQNLLQQVILSLLISLK